MKTLIGVYFVAALVAFLVGDLVSAAALFVSANILIGGKYAQKL